jgi:methionyl-tRNA formyltransferase
MNIIFMGTPVFAVPCLEALIAAGHNIQMVFSQPDKPKDRGQKILPPPVKAAALEHNISVFQPQSLRKGDDGEESHRIINELKPDCIVVVAYGQILPQDILDVPRLGCVNVHASLLPKYRGASPINYTVMRGEAQTGVSVMYMSAALDAGDVILQQAVDIPEGMTASVLHDELMAMGPKLLMEALPMVENGTASRTPQDDAQSCYAPMITKQMCRIDWNNPAREIYNQIRGLSESPAAYTFLGGKRLKVYFAELINNEKYAGEPGCIVNSERSIVAMCGDGNALALTDIQLEGQKRIPALAFLNGRKIDPGDPGSVLK